MMALTGRQIGVATWRTWGVVSVVAAVVGLGAPAMAQQAEATDDADRTEADADPEGADDGGSESEAGTLREKVVWALGGYHFDPDRETLDELGSPDAVVSELQKLAEDRSVRPSMRMRAVEMLGLYPRKSVRRFLDNLLEEPSSEMVGKYRRVAELMRHRALTSLARIVDDATAVERLGPYLKSDDLQLRLTAISALGEYAGDAGQARLRRFEDRAEDETLEDSIDRRIERYIPESK